MEMVRPVSYRDAQRYRWATFLHAFLSVVLSLAAMLASEHTWPDWHNLLVAAGLAFAVGLLLVVLPGAGSYALESRRLPVERRNRGIALSYYTWAPLAAWPLGLLLVVAAFITDLGWDTYRSDAAFKVMAAFLLGGALFPAAALVLAEARLALLARHVLCGQGRLWWRMILVNVATVAALALAAFVALSVIYFMIIWHSFH
jgi:MFS family permease